MRKQKVRNVWENVWGIEMRNVGPSNEYPNIRQHSERPTRFKSPRAHQPKRLILLVEITLPAMSACGDCVGTVTRPVR